MKEIQTMTFEPGTPGAHLSGNPILSHPHPHHPEGFCTLETCAYSQALLAQMRGIEPPPKGPRRVVRTIVLMVEVNEGPYDVDDTIAELGAALPNVIDDAWAQTDDENEVNALRVVRAIDAQRGVEL